MSKSIEDYESLATNNPVRFAIKIILILFLLGGVAGTCSYFMGWFSEGAAVAKQEFGPRALLKKYEWFKDASAQLDKKKADIAVYDQRVSQIKKDYQHLSREKWPREDREQFYLWQSEVAGVKSSFNDLASEYNSQMAKFNWRFANRGDLPQGATEPLPREYKTYLTN